MTDIANLDTHNGVTEHDMWADFDYNENTGKLQDLFNETALDKYIDNLNDWD